MTQSTSGSKDDEPLVLRLGRVEGQLLVLEKRFDRDIDEVRLQIQRLQDALDVKLQAITTKLDKVLEAQALALGADMHGNVWFRNGVSVVSALVAIAAVGLTWLRGGKG